MLWLYKGTGSGPARRCSPYPDRRRLEHLQRRRAVGDITGDGHADLVARDRVGRPVALQGHRIRHHAAGGRVRICSGWNIYKQLG